MQSHLSYFWFVFHYNVDMPRELTRLEMKSVSNTTSYVINQVLIGIPYMWPSKCADAGVHISIRLSAKGVYNAIYVPDLFFANDTCT